MGHGFDFDFAVTAPFRMQPGLRRRSPQAPLLNPSVPRQTPALAEKLRVLRHHGCDALLSAHGFDAGPALDALIDRVAGDHPDALRRCAGRGIEAPRLGWAVSDGQARPMTCRAGAADDVEPDAIGAVLAGLPARWRLPALLALSVEEDLAIVDGAGGTVPWLAVCLPSFWSPRDKIGRHFAQIHQPVADGQLLRAAGDHLMRLVSGADHWERFGWTVTPHPRLAADPRHDPRPAWRGGTPDQLAGQAWFRTEHQVFLPVPGRMQAVFTIRVALRPLADAIDTPARAQRLHEALASMSDAVLDYRGLAPARDGLIAGLERQAGRGSR